MVRRAFSVRNEEFIICKNNSQLKTNKLKAAHTRAKFVRVMYFIRVHHGIVIYEKT